MAADSQLSGTQRAAIVLLTLVFSAPGALLAVAFNAMFADVVAPERRGMVVGRRNALLSGSLIGTSLLCGWLLEGIRFPAKYQIVLGLGLLGAVMSTVHLVRIHSLDGPIPLRIGRPLNDAARPGLVRFSDALRLAPGLRFLTRSPGRSLLRLDVVRGPFGRLLAAFLAFYFAMFVPVPLFPLFWVNDLRLSDGAISLGSALFFLMMLLVSLGLRRLSARLGHRRVMILSALFYGLYPLLTGLARGATLFLAASITGGAVWNLLNGGMANRMMERVPEGDRPAHMALHNLVLNVGILAGSLAEWLGLRETLLLSVGLRLAGAALLWLWG